MIGEAFAAELSAAEVSPHCKKPLTVLFTSDLHSKLSNISQLKSLIDNRRKIAEERGDAVVVVDAGDIAMGTVYSTQFSSAAIELLSLGLLGYDAVTFGNHDFDYGLNNLAKMFFTADSVANMPLACLPIATGHIKLPAFLNSNLLFDNETLNKALKQVKSSPDTIITSNGVKVGIIGSVGEDCFSTIADSKGIEYINQMEAVSDLSADLRERGADYVIVLSHSGTYHKKGSLKSPDALLAKSLHGRVDAIISGHDHIPLFEPLKIGGVAVGNAGCYGNYLGEIRLNGNSVEYKLYPVIASAQSDSTVAVWLNEQKNKTAKYFESYFGINISDTVALFDTDFLQGRNSCGNSPLGNIIAEAYRETAVELLKNKGFENIVSVVPDGTVRASINKGAVTYADCYEILSLGKDSRGRAGYPLVLVYLYGRELCNIAELTPSIGDYIPDAKLSFAGLCYTYNRYALPVTKVREVFIGKQKINKNELYPVVGSYYTASLLGLMEESSFGLLRATPKDCNGNVITDLENCILRDSLGSDIVEWMVLAEYLNNCYQSDPSFCITDRIKQIAFEKRALDNKDCSVWLLYLFLLSVVVVIPVAIRRMVSRG